MCGTACAPVEGDTTESRAGALAPGDPGNLDILFMIDNSSSMTSMQMKMIAQDPGFMKILEGFPNGLPNIHVAVVSSDMGAPGDQVGAIGCTQDGNKGAFQSAPQGTCTATTIDAGSNFISNVKGAANYTGKLEDVFACIATLGSAGCGFEHQLASVARALGADGAPVPDENVGFLRPDAELAIILLTNEDDCSAPANTTLFSLNGGQQGITNPLGPIANYRCNQFGHLCTDPTGTSPSALIAPPLTPPADATGNPPALTLTNCESNDTSSGMLTSIASFVAGIKALKANPDSQIVVGAIAPPATPYTVEWVPPAAPPPGSTGELWPQIEHSCGAQTDSYVNPHATQFTTDGTYGDPGVRIAQWVHGFGDNGVVTSVCDADYGASFQKIADKILAHLQPSTSTGAGGAGGAAGAHGTGVGGVGGAPATGAAGAGGHGGAGGGGAAGQSGATGMGGTAGHAAVGGSSGTGAGGAAGQNGGTGVGGASTGAAGVTGTAGATGNAGATGTTGTAGASGAAGRSGGTAGKGGGAGGISATGGRGGAGGGIATGATGGGAAGGESGGAGGASATGGRAGSGGAAGAAGSPHENAGSSGCSCETAPRQTNGTTLAFLLLAGTVFTRRRRRR